MFHEFDFRDLVLVDRVPTDRLIPLFPRRPTVRILIVADTSVSFTSSFGVGMVIDLIRANVDGYVRFEVDLARLGTQGSTLMVDNTPAPKAPRYDNFRFSSQVGGSYVLDNYDEVWCFGFAPGNDGSSNDANISNSPYASTDQDLAVLTQWMNAGGGVLAMGDHHYLGAAMCSRIPRVRSMRRWTNAQNVPPIDGPDRFDTNRPQNAAQDPNLTASPAVIPFDAQSDDVPQVIEWKKYSVPALFAFERRYRPHPLLCGGAPGGLVQAILPLRDELEQLHADPKAKLKLSPELIEKHAALGAKKGIAEFHASVKENLVNLESLARLSENQNRQRRPRQPAQVEA